MRIGKVYNPLLGSPVWFGLSAQDLNQNLLVGGRAGSGKTNLFMVVLDSLFRMGIPFWIIDFKRDYRHLTRLRRDLLVFNWRNFRFNPLEPPPGTDPLYWIQILTDIFFQAFFPSPAAASQSAFLEFLDKLFDDTKREFGRNVIPSFIDLAEMLQRETGSAGRLPSSGKQRLLTCHSRIRPLVGILGKMFDCRSGYSMEDLLQRNVVFEFDGLTQDNRHFNVLCNEAGRRSEQSLAFGPTIGSIQHKRADYGAFITEFLRLVGKELSGVA